MEGNVAQHESVTEIQKEYNMEIDQNNEALENEDAEAADVVTPPTAKKRRTRAKTPIVDDEVRRCSRFKRQEEQSHFQLDNEPRRKKGAAKKTVSISAVEDLRTAIVSRSLEEDMEGIEIEPIQAPILVEFGTFYCGVPPMELSMATLCPEDDE
jgi:hypothetical protein